MPNIIETGDAAAGTSTGYGLGIGQTAQGQVGANGDHDWFRVDLVAGQQYTFGLVGSGLSTTHLHDTFLRLRNAGGAEVVASDDDGPGLFSTITYTATTTGAYYLDVSDYGNAVGQYTLSAITGSRANYDTVMGAAALLRPDLSWSAPGTSANVTWGVRETFAGSVDAQGNAAPFSQLSAAQIAAVQASLNMFSDVANITFNQVNSGGTTDNATMLFSNYNSATDGAGAYASYPGSTSSTDAAGDVRLNTQSVSTTSLPAGSYSFFTVLHEIGHAVGLAHPGDYNAAPGVSITYGTHAQFIQDSHQYTVMSYFDESNTTTSYGQYPQTLMLYDIYALQLLYGADMATRAGHTVYGFNTTEAGTVFDASINSAPVFCIWDAGGIDTVDLSGVGVVDQLINLTAGSFSNIGGLTANVSIAYGVVIEQAVGGAGNDSFVGNDAINVFNGNAGIDTLNTRAINGAASHTFTYNGLQYALTRGQGADTLMGIEQVSDGGQTINVATLGGFDPLAYGASYNDLAFAFRTDGAAAFQHYLNYGFNEGREAAFDANQYLANWGDLRAAFGTNTAAATQHFLVYGVGEHRLADDPLAYVASYADLINAFRGGSQQQLVDVGLNHYSGSGYNEQRRNGINFDVGQYLANYGDIANAFGSNLDAATTHFINNGYAEHRLWENPLRYVASFTDLTQAFGGMSMQQLINTALAHFQGSGFNERRLAGVDFDVDAYLANYGDLRGAFDTGTGGYDEVAATYHYITYGFDEGRTDTLLV